MEMLSVTYLRRNLAGIRDTDDRGYRIQVVKNLVGAVQYDQTSLESKRLALSRETNAIIICIWRYRTWYWQLASYPSISKFKEVVMCMDSSLAHQELLPSIHMRPVKFDGTTPSLNLEIKGYKTSCC